MKTKSGLVLTIIIGILLILAGCAKDQDNGKQQPKEKTKFQMVQAKTIKIKQIRGIGFPGNDQGLYVATDQGLKIYENGNWQEMTTNRHDYIGFQATETGFVASGHPEKGSALKDPLGLIESNDKGENITKLAFYGKLNFHFLSAGYSNPILYIINTEQRKDLPLGITYSTDRGKNFQTSELAGFNADSLGMIAVHPIVGKVMAMATRSGIYYSEDFGNTMKLVTDPVMVTALTFKDDTILYSSVENEKILLKTLLPKTGEKKDVAIPFLSYENPITYIAVNQKNQNEMAFTTYNNDVYQSVDGGKTWNPLLIDGKKER